MSDKVNVVYIGPKPIKRDTVAGTRTVFPRLKPVPVDPDVAYRLTDFPRVWIYESQLDEHEEEQAKKAALEAQRQAELEAQAKAEAEAANMEVEVNGQTIDISKFTGPKLATLIESAELDIEPKGSAESVTDFRARVRDALRARQEG